jgi:hypothetical protein
VRNTIAAGGRAGAGAATAGAATGLAIAAGVAGFDTGGLDCANLSASGLARSGTRLDVDVFGAAGARAGAGVSTGATTSGATIAAGGVSKIDGARGSSAFGITTGGGGSATVTTGAGVAGSGSCLAAAGAGAASPTRRTVMPGPGLRSSSSKRAMAAAFRWRVCSALSVGVRVTTEVQSHSARREPGRQSAQSRDDSPRGNHDDCPLGMSDLGEQLLKGRSWGHHSPQERDFLK